MLFDHVIPSDEVFTTPVVESGLTITKRPEAKSALLHWFRDVAVVRRFQVIPSVDVATLVVEADPVAVIRKVVALAVEMAHVTPPPGVGSVLAVQVIPSVEVAPPVAVRLNEKKVDPTSTADCQDPEPIVPVFHVRPSMD